MSRVYHHPPLTDKQMSDAIGEYRTWDDQVRNHHSLQSIDDLIHRIAECIMPETRLLYLASPYSDPDPAVMEQRRVQVCRTAGSLIKRGIAVHSPIAHNVAILRESGGETGWSVWKSQDLAMLSVCSEMAVLCLPGWERSTGVTDEIKAAVAAGKKISYIQPTQ